MGTRPHPDHLKHLKNHVQTKVQTKSMTITANKPNQINKTPDNHDADKRKAASSCIEV